MTAPGTVLSARSEQLLDGGYGVSISVGEDRAWILDRPRAVAYAVTCFARATEAEHDAAIFILLKCRGVPVPDAARTVAYDVRPARIQDDTATTPLTFTCAVNAASEPFIIMSLDGEQTGQMSPEGLRRHGSAVLSVLAAADLDDTFRRVLTGILGVDDHKAQNLVGALEQHWPGQVHQ